MTREDDNVTTASSAPGAQEGPGDDARGSTEVRATTRLPRGARGESSPNGEKGGSGKPGDAAGGRHHLSDCAKRNLAVFIASLGVVAIVFLSFAFVELGNAPTADQIEADAHNALSNPSYGGGMYGSDDPLDLETVRILEIKRTRGGADPAVSVHVQANLTNGSIDALCEAYLDYDRIDNRWVLMGPPAGVTYAYSAIKGVDQSKLAISIDDVLAKAETSLRSDGDDGGSQVSLPTLYGDASMTVLADDFDKEAQTDKVTLQLERKNAYTQRAATINAEFKFMAASGLWELTGATAEEGAKDLDLTPLMGTWTGTFMSQESSGAKCLAAAGHGLSIHITKVDGQTISGTLSGVAHFHAVPGSDQNSTEGDRDLADVAFSGALDSDASDSHMTFTCKVADMAGGSVGLALSFEDGDPDDSATAKLTSTYEDESSILLIIPVHTTDTYADTYELTKTE